MAAFYSFYFTVHTYHIRFSVSTPVTMINVLLVVVSCSVHSGNTVIKHACLRGRYFVIGKERGLVSIIHSFTHSLIDQVGSRY